ncbi:hypothetical protein ACQPX6_30025 [Actinomycetospora sp. CA-101289]|uniref:hypothetical protein n=1 Tax=Actinomycetospora sp. CA-101289 TaxID=3239893 RepID=UPI003D969E0D
MSEIRTWAVGALAVVAIAVGTGAGVQIARTSDAPVAPVVAVVPEVTAPPTSAPPASVAAPSTTATTPSATTRATTTRPTTTRTTRTTRAPRSTTRDRPAADGGSAAQSYRGCVNASNSPGAVACRALVDAGVRGE